MRLSKSPSTYIYSYILIVYFAFSLLFSGCKKTADLAINESPENISKQELMVWINSYEKIMQGGPKPLIEKTQKTYFKGQMILKMPLSSGGGHLYFTKTNKLEVQFFRIVSSDNQINNPFNGYYEFIDMITYKYKKIKFKEGIRQTSTNTNTSIINSIQNTSTVKSTETWLGAFFRCLVTHIIAIPRRDKYGEWRCYGFGGESSDPSEVDEVNSDLQDSGGGFDWASWFLFLNPPNFYTTNPIPDPSIVWDPYLGGGGSYPPNPPDETQITTGFINQLGYYTPYSQSEIDNYFNRINQYWLAADYDFIQPYDPVIDGERDIDGFRRNGPEYNYTDGVIQNFTNDNGEKYAIFTDLNGVKIKFPGATITDHGILERRGVTTPNGGIHMSTIGNGLVDLQHEYGHYLHAKAIGVTLYYSVVVPESLYSATFNGANHRFTWTEVVANKLSALYFGPNSPIATSTFYPKSF